MQRATGHLVQRSGYWYFASARMDVQIFSVKSSAVAAHVGRQRVQNHGVDALVRICCLFESICTLVWWVAHGQRGRITRLDSHHFPACGSIWGDGLDQRAVREIKDGRVIVNVHDVQVNGQILCTCMTWLNHENFLYPTMSVWLNMV